MYMKIGFLYTYNFIIDIGGDIFLTCSCTTAFYWQKTRATMHGLASRGRISPNLLQS